MALRRAGYVRAVKPWQSNKRVAKVANSSATLQFLAFLLDGQFGLQLAPIGSRFGIPRLFTKQGVAGGFTCSARAVDKNQGLGEVCESSVRHCALP